ncbi:serine hydrolase [Spirosoma utsteinense]|uniref:beta-lactamase n=1 Tax=Spirosoma utsteinense TaxID=2585773 RepID=A0ABR6W7V4_9BACT|nr:serine hydrolase [Spirosoma utsteinense]MBC3787727.1 beta-lactamase class A [Spirosoma utsteinense]MBC3792669.1 beta-lactamase class A [Spirosoma utsteinense]
MKLLYRAIPCLAIAFTCLVALRQPGVAQSRLTLPDLRQKIDRELSQQTGIFAVAFKDVATGQELLIREREEFHAASTMKTPVMIEVYKQQAAHSLSLSDSMLVKTEFKSIVDGSPYSLNAKDDSDTSIYRQVGTRRTLGSLVYDMIIVSSNLATNLVIERVGAQQVTQTMRDLGARDIQVRRGVEDSKAFARGLNNTTTAYDLMMIFDKLATGQAVSPEASKAMIGTLLDQRFNDAIPARLPASVKVAHKTGSVTGVRHDSGIVFLPDGRKYVLVLLSKDISDDKKTSATMATVSEWIYQYMMQG